MESAVRSIRFVLLAALTFGCDGKRADVREWRPEDHDHTTNPGAEQVVGGPDAGPAPELARHGLDEVTVVAWQQNCTRCHGRIGRGDGPQGAMFRATDLSNPEWQAAMSDEQMALAIKNGRGAMPPFPLPDSTIQGLVRLIRLLRAEPEGEPGAAPSGAPGSSAAPAPSAAPSPASSVAPASSTAPASSAR